MAQQRNDKLWWIYLDKVDTGALQSLGQLGLVELTQSDKPGLGLTGATVAYEPGPVVQGLLALVMETPEIQQQEEKDAMERKSVHDSERKIFQLGLGLKNASIENPGPSIKAAFENSSL